jgi:ketosteroid isomerase-like protein
MGIEENKQLAREFVAAISRGDVKAIEAAFADDGTCWTTGTMPISGRFTKAQVSDAASHVLDMFPDGLEISIRRMTAEDDRVAIEAESQGRHVSGADYHNVYHFLMRARDGQIVEWNEYMDTMHANEVLCGGG